MRARVRGVCTWCARAVCSWCVRGVCVRARAVLCLFVGGAHNVLLLTFFYSPLHIIYMNFIYILYVIINLSHDSKMIYIYL